MESKQFNHFIYVNKYSICRKSALKYDSLRRGTIILLCQKETIFLLAIPLENEIVSNYNILLVTFLFLFYSIFTRFINQTKIAKSQFFTLF